jgi:hypothetical protein
MTDLKLQDAEIDRLLASTPPPEAPPELARSIGGALAASLQPVKPMPGTSALAVQFAAVFLVFAVALIGMMGITGFRTLHAWQAVGMVAILALGVTVLSVALAWQIRPGSLQKIPAASSWLYFGLGFVAGAALLFPWRSAEPFVASTFVSHGWHCLMAGSAVALPGGILFWLLSRRGVPLSAGAFGGTLGAIAGLLGVTVLQFRCIYQDAAHLMVWHGGVVLVAIAAGVGIARLLERNRWARGEEAARAR